MAFVSVGATTFGGSALRAPTTAAVVCSPMRPAMAASDMARLRASTMAFSSIDAPETSVARVDAALETKANVLTAAYRHVFGNAYLMEAERAELAIPESEFLLGKRDVRELVRAMAKSAGYKKRFFEKSGPYRFVELNCKHLLGRGPTGQAEISFHVQKLINEGYEAEIDSYLDSPEYEERFGALDVPRFIYKGAYPKNDDFNRLSVMRMHWDGCSTSTKHGSTAPGRPMSADLLMADGSYVSGFTKVQKGLPAGRSPAPARPYAPFAGFPKNPNAPLKIRIEVAPNLFQVYEVPAMVDAAAKVPEWKKVAAAVNPGHKWNGVFY
jgi:hypothetical protein